jgi:hypothetical protein
LTGDDYSLEFGLAPSVVRRECINYHQRETFSQQITFLWRQRIAPGARFGYELRSGLDAVRTTPDELAGFATQETQRTLLQQRVTMDWSLGKAWTAELAVDQRLSTVVNQAGTEEGQGGSFALGWQVWRGTKLRGEVGCASQEDLRDVELTRTRRALRLEQQVPYLPLTLRAAMQEEETDRELAPWEAREVRTMEGSLTWKLAPQAEWTLGAQQTEVEQVERWVVDSRESAWSQWQFAPWQDQSVRARAQVDQRDHADPVLSYDYDPTMTLETGWQTKWTEQFQTGLTVKYRSFDAVTPVRTDLEETMFSIGAAGSF